MMYKAKVAVCPDIRTKHSKQSERHVEFLNVKTWWYVQEPLGVKRLNVLHFNISTLRRICAVPNMAVFFFFFSSSSYYYYCYFKSSQRKQQYDDMPILHHQDLACIRLECR